MDDSTGQPVRTAWVTLLRDREIFAEGLTRLDGSRFFPADPSARYTALVERIGHEPFTSAPFAVPRDTGAVEVRLPVSRIAFGPLGGGVSCGPPDGGLAAQLWRQIRIVLNDADRTTADGLEMLAIRRSERVLDRDGTPKVESPVDGRSLGTRLFATAPPDVLSRSGFFGVDVAGARVYYGPDVAYLLSPEFLADHCFGTAQGSGATHGFFGLRFQPRKEQRVAGITGTLWVDGVSGELRLLEFGYTGDLPADAREIGGRVLFDRLPSGSWIAREWMIRTPIATQAGQLLGYRMHGGEALAVPPSMLLLADSIENARKPPGRITGVVIDSLTNRGLAGALVYTDMDRPRARTEADGTFYLRDVPAGWRRVTFSHPTLDSLGVRMVPTMIRVGPDSTTHVVFGGPSLRTLKGGACADSLAVLTGVVRDVATGQPIQGAQVALSWVEIQFQPDKPLAVHPVDVVDVTDSTGRYAYCVPARLEITAFAEAGGMRTGRVDVRPDDRRVSLLDLTIDRTATDTIIGSAEIHGTVLYQDNTPIPDATVRLFEPERSAVSDSMGRFRIAAIPGGTRVLDARAMGHAPVRVVVNATPADTSAVRVYMRKVTTLDAIVVRASAGVAGRAIVELEERRRAGVGYRLTPIELLGFKHSRLAAVMRSLPFVRVRSGSGGMRVSLTTVGGRECTPTIWVDGIQSDVDVLDLYSASDALAVEVFNRATQVPINYRTRSTCGAVLLWTREGAKK